MIIAHKIALDPNNVQATYFARAAGTARFAYNWALAEWKRQYEACGHRLDALPLSVREWACPACGVIHDRDVNAATNLKNLAVSSTVSACGEEGAGRCLVAAVKPASVKQEASSRFS